MTQRAFYSATFKEFLSADSCTIVGEITSRHTQQLQFLQTKSWLAEIELLKSLLSKYRDFQGHIFFEFMIPRMGRRADVIIVFKGHIFVIEFKVGKVGFNNSDMRQAHGYALDLKNFHSASHNKFITPILVSTKTHSLFFPPKFADDGVAETLCINEKELIKAINQIATTSNQENFDAIDWSESGYLPTPTIIEAAQALYAEHKVEDIARSEADSQNLGQTSYRLQQLIHEARSEKRKIICFVTGVPGAGKTLVGLNIASSHSNPEEEEYSVFLSGNGPLVSVLQEALAKDRNSRTSEGLGECRRYTEQFIQNIHKFRDDSLDGNKPPEQVAIFDEAQRAWNAEQTSKFMQTKRNQIGFNKSEPEYLIEVMDRHKDWAVIVALIGGGQEINTGEIGLSGWLDALKNKFSHWNAYYSADLLNGEYVSTGLDSNSLSNGNLMPCLHLATSMRSFRAEKLSSCIHYLIAGNSELAKQLYGTFKHLYPIKITRNLEVAKSWIKLKSRANESKGMLASSNGIRLKAEGIFVKNTIEPKAWFLGQSEDIRSSHFLEDVATEFDVQGLEIDWGLVAWDADYRFGTNKFEHWRFRGTRWEQRKKAENQRYLENAYRVLMTRSRQGMVIFLPEGNDNDITRKVEFYDNTFKYLKKCGIEEI
ncbi:DUF2075 domain-containing protein [Shewanella sp. GutDb-MelDb]|uniref:DUF2075 domain-containing protein n=1 Tax=Shewanella sp. GutDb-MelDb TaxID=2058316 RepID=UPI000C7C49C2|nr:DUF2075 domain-containing protein [Shewanella sp. GutDb-MelDb]PKG56045.1 hypothetical protein CXF82_16615 [Shewanella sp. GutDb-MelDb]